MTIMSRDERKHLKGKSRLFSSFKYSANGLKYAYKNEQTVWLHLPVSIIVIIFGFVFKISAIEWTILLLIIGLILSLELVNTAIEAAVDLVTEQYNPIAKIAKDAASASVLIFAITSIIVGLIIFVPKIIAIF